MPRGASGPLLPLGVTPPENSPSRIGQPLAGMSTSTQWQKFTRGSDAGMVRPSLFTSSAFDGTSGSWQMMHHRLRALRQVRPREVRIAVLRQLDARRGIGRAERVVRRESRAPSAKLSLQNFMAKL